MADTRKPYPVAQAIADGHSPEDIGIYLRGEGKGREVDSTGVPPYVMRKVLAPVPHIPASRVPQGPFGTSRPPLSPDAGMTRPAPYIPPRANPTYGTPSVPADVTSVMDPRARGEANPSDPFGWMAPTGMTLGAISGGALSVEAGGLGAVPVAGIGGAIGKGASQFANRIANTGYVPQNAREAIRGMSGAGLEGMATEVIGMPIGAAAGVGSKWLGNRILRGGVGMSDRAASAMAAAGAAATKAGAEKLAARSSALDAALTRAVSQADRMAGGPSVSTIDVMAPLRDLWFRHAENNVVSSAPAHKFAQMWMHAAGKYGNAKVPFTKLLEIKRIADNALDYNKMAQAGKMAKEFVLSSEEEQAYKAVADNARNILNGIQNVKVPVRGVGNQMTIAEINNAYGATLEAERAVKATFERPQSAKLLPFAAGAGTFYGSHDPAKAALAYVAASAASDPAINSHVALMLQNPALLGVLRGVPQNAGRVGIGMMGGTGTK